MLEKLKATLARLRRRSKEGANERSNEEDRRTLKVRRFTERKKERDQGSHLFRCPSCGTVYIDTDKRSCSNCETDVEQIPATLSESGRD